MNSVATRAKLQELGFVLPTTPLQHPTHELVAATRVGDLVFTSGQVSFHGEDQIKGRVGRGPGDVSVREAKYATRFAVVNALAAIDAVANLDHVLRVIKLTGMVNYTETFDDFSSIIDAGSRLLAEIWGEHGKHARTAIGVRTPADWTVEVELIVQLMTP